MFCRSGLKGNPISVCVNGSVCVCVFCWWMSVVCMVLVHFLSCILILHKGAHRDSWFSPTSPEESPSPPPHTFFQARFETATVSGIPTRREQQGRQQRERKGGGCMGVGMGARWNVKNVLERAWSTDLHHFLCWCSNGRLCVISCYVASDLPPWMEGLSLGNFNPSVFSSYNRQFNYSTIP